MQYALIFYDLQLILAQMGGGARRRASVAQSRGRTCGEKKRLPREQRRIEAGARPSTVVRCRQERCSACAERRSGDVG
jgi:hypothetical protein